MTDIALRDYFERLLGEADRRYEQRFAASELAVSKAERTMTIRLDSMNEFRDALRDQASRMATRVELEKLDLVVQGLQQARANLDGRLIVLSGGVSGFVAVLVWALTKFF